MKTSLHIDILMFLLAFTACSLEVCLEELPAERRAIGFSPGFSATKAATEYASAADLSTLGVFASFTHGSFAANVASAIPNFMYNQYIERQTDGFWLYSPVRFWPVNTNDKISFFAYAPYVDEATAGGSNPTFIAKSGTGYPHLTYTVPTTESEQTDLLAATPLMDQTSESNGGTVNFALKHALTKVAVFVKSNDNISGKKVTAFSLQAPQHGTLTWKTPANPNDVGFNWTYAGMESFPVANTSISVPSSTTAEKVLLATFLLLPRGEGNTFSITYTAPGSLLTQTISLTNQPLPSLDDWKQGSFISYTIGIEKKKITVTAASHPVWNDGGTGTVTGSVVITYAVSSTDPGWGNGGTGMVDGQPVVTHTEQDITIWQPGTSETLDGTETTP